MFAQNIRSMVHKRREQILYLVFGVATTLVNWVVYTLSLLFFSLTVSNSIAWFFAVVFAFIVNKIYVFRSVGTSTKKTFKELSLFFYARIFSGIFEIAGLPLLVWIGLDQKIFGIEGAVAKIVISVIVIVLNYLFSKFVIFKK